MADTDDLRAWAQRSGADAAEVESEQGEGGEGQEQEGQMTPLEAYQHAANEVEEAVAALEALPDDDDSEARREICDALGEQVKLLDEKIKELGGDGGEEDDEEEDEGGEGAEGQEAAGG